MKGLLTYLKGLFGKNRQEEEPTNWIEWLGVEESDTEKLYAEAKKRNVPVLPGDTPQVLYARLYSHKFNKTTIIVNVVLAAISLISAAVAVYEVCCANK